jgi:hypothetical protein
MKAGVERAEREPDAEEEESKSDSGVEAAETDSSSSELSSELTVTEENILRGRGRGVEAAEIDSFSSSSELTVTEENILPFRGCGVEVAEMDSFSSSASLSGLVGTEENILRDRGVEVAETDSFSSSELVGTEENIPFRGRDGRPLSAERAPRRVDERETAPAVLGPGVDGGAMPAALSHDLSNAAL